MKKPKAGLILKKDLTFNVELIAPCGMDCRLCMAYIRERKACPGCRGDNLNKAKTCAACKIKNCVELANGNYAYCFSCDHYPCEMIKHIDKRYRTNYGMSMIENLENIRQSGIEDFVEQEKNRWRCPECGGTLCVHYAQCPSCDYTWR